MEKRLIIAIALSMLVVIAWSALQPKPVQKITSLPQPVVSVDSANKKEALIVIPETPPDAKIIINNENFKLSLSEPLAAIKDVTFDAYQSTRFMLNSAFFIDDKELKFKRLQDKGRNIEFVSQDQNKQVIKRFNFLKEKYSLELEIETRNLSNSDLVFSDPILLGDINFKEDKNQVQFLEISFSSLNKTDRLNGRKDFTMPALKVAAFRDKYFCLIVEPQGDYSGFVKKIDGDKSAFGIVANKLVLKPGEKNLQKFRIYLGPQDVKLISAVNPDWTFIIHYGTFDVISSIFLKLLEFLHGVTRNWGWSIILLSFLIYALLFPFTLKQMRSMKEMQVLQPRIEELRKALKDNPQKLNKEIMQLYKEHKVNPLSGCLPLLLQMPIFFALYQALTRAIALKGASFFWIKDLSEPDRLFMMPFNLPLLGNEFNLLPIIMAIGMFVQQKVSSVAGSGPAAEQQKIMLVVMPVMFGFIFYRMPSGLVLYWLINSLLMLFYQLRISRTK